MAPKSPSRSVRASPASSDSDATLRMGATPVSIDKSPATGSSLGTLTRAMKTLEIKSGRSLTKRGSSDSGSPNPQAKKWDKNKNGYVNSAGERIPETPPERLNKASSLRTEVVASPSGKVTVNVTKGQCSDDESPGSLADAAIAACRRYWNAREKQYKDIKNAVNKKVRNAQKVADEKTRKRKAKVLLRSAKQKVALKKKADKKIMSKDEKKKLANRLKKNVAKAVKKERKTDLASKARYARELIKKLDPEQDGYMPSVRHVVGSIKMIPRCFHCKKSARQLQEPLFRDQRIANTAPFMLQVFSCDAHQAGDDEVQIGEHWKAPITKMFQTQNAQAMKAMAKKKAMKKATNTK
eukprot:TRINITY_DN79634_c0_g1_i1.p1 TRINITY_DN79634_c0_g1~~TRINITY_DN79634_c0_g1_i1.p1  ORF type:complete len:353 (-),score=92.76 TRINITY_DN79634_c0_g1_i1:210-1268(-)